MNIGIFAQSNRIESLVKQAQEIEADGFETMWTPQIFGIDALTALAVVARETTTLRFGTAVIPTYPRHPFMLASQAKTVSTISDGRLILGIGLSHKIVIEGQLGMSYEKPVRHMREYLDILGPLLANEQVRSKGETLTFRGGNDFEAPPTPLLIAAMGPAMLKLTGARADGTSLWMTGPKTIAAHIAPTINAAAEAADRPQPQIVASLPICVTDDEPTARAQAAEQFAMYDGLPSYRAMMDREGADGPADLAIIGTEDQVAEQIAEVFAAGATTLTATRLGNRDEQAATRDLLKRLNAA